MGGAGAPPPMGMRKYMGDESGQPTGEGDPSSGDPMGMTPPAGGTTPMPNSGMELPTPSSEELRKYDLDIRDFEKEMDEPEIDQSEVE